MVDLLIICPVLNEANSIGRLLNSLSQQVRSSFSVLFVDSGSIDGTWQILDLFCKGRSDCELIRFDENLGVSKNWGRALRLALEIDAQLMCFVAGDDWISDGYVYSVLEASQLHPNSTVVPKFMAEGPSGWAEVITKPLTHEALLKDWSLVHLCYSVFDKRFMSEHYLPILLESDTVFDWWVSFSSILERKQVICVGAEYFKSSKGLDYKSNYYSPSYRQRKTRPKVDWLLFPIVETANWLRGGGSVLRSLKLTTKLDLTYKFLLMQLTVLIKNFLQGSRTGIQR